MADAPTAAAAAAQAKAYRDALIETWTLYGAGTVFIMLRVFVRTKLVGFRGYRPDDYLIWVCWAAYTGMTVAAHIVGGTGDTSHLSMAERLAMTPAQRQSRSLGSKWFMVGWYTYITLIWSLKFNMLCLYQRVVSGCWVERFIRPAQGFVVASALSIYILFATGCRPFPKLWQVLPDPGPYCCPQSPVFLITVLVLNLVTDCILIAIPAPMIIPLKTSIYRKIGLVLLFSGGAFTMVAAILRVWYVLAQQQGQTAAIWSCREDVIAILVGQATMIKPLFSKRFWNLINNNTTQDSNSYPSKPGQGSGGVELSNQSQNVGPRKGLRKPKDPYNISALESRNESEERIVEDDGNGHVYSDLKTSVIKEHEVSVASAETRRSSGDDHTIKVQKTVDIESVGDAGYTSEQKPNYGHNSRIHSKWNAF